MKLYVQNGFNKALYHGKTKKDAAIDLIKSLLTISKTENKEYADLAPVTTISDYGYLSDILEMKLYDQLDKVIFIRTTSILTIMKRPDIAKFLRQHIKTLDPEVRKLISNIPIKLTI